MKKHFNIEESKYCSEVMKKYSKKELVVTRKENEHFQNPIKHWIYDNTYGDRNVKVRDHCHITGKYRGSTHRDCNINFKLNHKITIVFHNLKDFDDHLMMQELGQFNIKINVISNRL